MSDDFPFDIVYNIKKSPSFDAATDMADSN